MKSRSDRTCLSVLDGQVPDGDYFTPVGKDVCEKCKCLAGKAVGCFNQTCHKLPDCEKYESIQGKCCEFECLEGDGLSNKAELAVVLSLSVGLVLLLIMLIAVLCCRRQNLKKNQEQQTKTTTQSTSSGTQQVEPSNNDSEQPGTDTVSSTDNRSEERSGGIELPPPYYPENVVTVNSGRTRQPLPPNEPPPPYDREESVV